MASPSDSDLSPGKYILFDMSQDYPRGETIDAGNEMALTNWISRHAVDWLDGRDPEELNLILIGPYPGRLNTVSEVQVRELWVTENEPRPQYSVHFPEVK
jgi:hypothetical protein